jgi:hypothetical protein
MKKKKKEKQENRLESYFSSCSILCLTSGESKKIYRFEWKEMTYMNNFFRFTEPPFFS